MRAFLAAVGRHDLVEESEDPSALANFEHIAHTIPWILRKSESDELLSAENVRRRGLFRPEEVQRIIAANLSGREDYNLQVFQLLTLELWQRTFMD